MFTYLYSSCTCSKDALKLTNTDAKTGICAEGLSRNSTFRNRLAQEELKFSNTVVASGLDLLMIGTSAGRTKRERKVPSRYQDTDAFFDSNTGNKHLPNLMFFRYLISQRNCISKQVCQQPMLKKLPLF